MRRRNVPELQQNGSPLPVDMNEKTKEKVHTRRENDS